MINIKLTYDGGALNKRIEDALCESMEGIGAEFYASGMDLTTGVRDLSYEYKQKESK